MKILIIAILLFLPNIAHAYSEGVKNACRQDYYKFCSEWKSGTEFGRLCMFNNRFELSKRCQLALIRENYLEVYIKGLLK